MVQGPRVWSPSCIDVMQKADVINFPLHSSLGLHIRGPMVLKDGCTASRWRLSVDRTGGFALSDGLWRQSSASSLCTYLCGSLSLFSLCQQLLITPHWGMGHAWVSFGSPRALLLLPNLSSSGDRNELPTTIGAATVWWRGCSLPQGAKTLWNWRSESVTSLP